MNDSRERLITRLAAGLEPVNRPGQSAALVLFSVVASAVFALALLLAGGPFRPGSVSELAESPRFLVESLVGVAAIVALAATGLRLAVPALGAPLVRAALPLALLAAWIGFYVYGLHAPALEPSMAGKRAHCFAETLLAGLPGLAVGLVLARRLWPLHGAWSGFLIGLAAGATPALAMQFACMYLPGHILTHHVLPGLAVGLAGTALGAALLRPKRES